MEAAPAPVSQPYATMTTPTAVNVPTPRQRPFSGPDPRLREDVVTQPAFGARGARSMPWAPPAISAAEKQFLDFVAEGEAPGGYNQRFGERPGKNRYDLTSMTINEVIALPPNRAGGHVSAASGRYQFLRKPLAELRDHLGLTGEEQFTPGMQDYLAVERMRQMRDYDDFLSGSLSRERFALNVADEWASLPDLSTGLSRYDGQPAAHTPADLLAQVDALRTGVIIGPPAAADVPDPRLRPASDDPALGARGARFMGDTAAIDTDTFMPTQLAGAVNGEGQIVERGWRGGSVRELQTFLNDNGYTDARGRPLTVDGDFGRRTREAVKSFQAASQIEVDGRVGPETLSAILYTVDPSSSPMPGQVAYVDGANAARSIINPSAPEIAIPLPRQRPERGEGIPDPRMNPRRDPLGFMVDIDRPAIRNADGSISTERTETFEVDGQFWNIPTIVDGKQLSSDQAFAEYEAGRNAAVQGPFASSDEAVSAAKQRSEFIGTLHADAQQPAEWTDIDTMTEVDEEGNYVVRRPSLEEPPRRESRESSMPYRTDEDGNLVVGPADIGWMASEYRSQRLAEGMKEGPAMDKLVSEYGQLLKQSGRFRYASGWSAAEIGKEVSDKRQMFLEAGIPAGPQLDKITNDYERILKRIIAPAARQGQAVASARGATNRRLGGERAAVDRFRPRGTSRRSDDVDLVRSTEAVREFARGIADQYRLVLDRRRYAQPPSYADEREQALVTDALMQAAATPAEMVVRAYAFRGRS
jgi:peptidoglycan hydrolase-like protein with peptidoglycan-binding domain/muramidase (phage lysozyme)